MPELPEVETTRQGLLPYVVGQKVRRMVLNRRDLRWPISAALPRVIDGKEIIDLTRRGKYLVFHLADGQMLAHLGMSGSIRIANIKELPRKHDHWQLQFGTERELRFNDPRRFGALFWVRREDDWQSHDLIRSLGPEPLLDDFTADYLYQRSRGRSQPIKAFIMDSKVVVGVGNIYASEALFHAGIHPKLRAGKLSKPRSQNLVEQIKRVLSNAIERGGTTLRDYVNGAGQPGYFQQELWVYGRGGQPCKICPKEIKEIRLGQRSTCFCPQCQRR